MVTNYDMPTRIVAGAGSLGTIGRLARDPGFEGGKKRVGTVAEGFRRLEADPPAYAGGVPDIAVLATVVAVDDLPLRFPDHPWVEPIPRLRALRDAVSDPRRRYQERNRPMSDRDADKQLRRDYFDAFRRADEAWWAAHVSPGFVRHDPGLPFVVRGPAGLKQLADALLPGIPDLELPIEDVVAEDGKVLVRLRVVGTHGGELIGMAPPAVTSTSPSWTRSTSATACLSNTGPCSIISPC